MKINNIITVALGSMLAFAACTDGLEYTPAPLEDAAKTYVNVDKNAARNLDIDGSDIEVPFVRNSKTGAMDITVALTDTSGLFTLKNTTVSFADGDSTAVALVSYSYDDLDPAATYGITVGIVSEGVASEYAPVALPLTCKKAWQNLGMAQFYDDWWLGFILEKQLLKAPDGSETYRLVNPYDKQSVVDGGLSFVSEIPYLEFVINEDGSISYSTLLHMGFKLTSGQTCHMVHPAALGDAASAANNKMVLENVAQFCWYPIINYDASTGGFSWWGETSVAYISFPGGPDLAEVLAD